METLNSDVLLLILHRLDDCSLGRLFQVATQFNRTPTELFWQQKLEGQFKGLLRLRKLFSSWRDFYINAMEASYLVWSSTIRLYKDIREAYKEFIHRATFGSVKTLPIEEVQRLPEYYKRKIREPTQLYIVFPDRPIHDSDHLLLSVKCRMDSFSRVISEPEFLIADGLAELPTLERGIFDTYLDKGMNMFVRKNRKLSRMIDRSSEVTDDGDFRVVSQHYLAEVLGDGFEIFGHHLDSRILIKGGLEQDRFKKYFMPDYNRDDYEETKDEEYIPFTVEYNESGLQMWMGEFDLISTTPAALEINRILLRARSIPGFLDY